LPKSYDEETFRLLPEIERDRDIAFLGRLVRYKGADLLIDAAARLAARGIQAKTIVIGQGPEEAALKQQAGAAGIAKLVEFAGPQQGEALAALLNRHEILVIPSRYDEAFGSLRSKHLPAAASLWRPTAVRFGRSSALAERHSRRKTPPH
jgi:glycogen synthase